MTPVQQYSELLTQKAALETKLKLIEGELKSLEPTVLAWFEQCGIDSARLDDGRTLYLRREIWANSAAGVRQEDAVRALVESGLGDFCQPRINASRLSAWARELDRDNEPLPARLQGIIEIREVFKVGHRKGSES